MTFLTELNGAALIREVHVYGQQVLVGKRCSGEKQHGGFGIRLMNEAENIARNSGYNKLYVISGIGMREYSKKLGYMLDGTYMGKWLT